MKLIYLFMGLLTTVYLASIIYFIIKNYSSSIVGGDGVENMSVGNNGDKEELNRDSNSEDPVQISPFYEGNCYSIKNKVSLAEREKTSVLLGEMKKGIYLDFIYNPQFYYENLILYKMLRDIIDRNPQMGYYYDFDNKETSAIVSLGFEHYSKRAINRDIILIKPKLLKDILYTQDIFIQIYGLLLNYFRSCVEDETQVPEYDRMINFKLYRLYFSKTLKTIDKNNFNKVICRNEEINKYFGRICLRVDKQYINSVFNDSNTKHYWIEILSKIAWLIGTLLSETFNFTFYNRNNLHSSLPIVGCYNIELKPEVDVRKVLLYPHKAVKTASLTEILNISDYTRIANDIILYKHRCFHALGDFHVYTKESIMNSYDNIFQTNNLFTILEEDLVIMSNCYMSKSRNYVTNNTQFPQLLFDLFVSEDFSGFMRRYKSLN